VYPPDRAPGLVLGDGVRLGEGVRFGAHVVVHAGARIAAGAVIQDGAVIGKAPALGRHSRAARPAGGAATVVEAGAVVGCHAVIVAGAHIGPGAVVADHVLVREGARLEEAAVVGHGGTVGVRVVIGARSKLMSFATLPPGTLIEEDVFIGPCFIVTDDPTMGRHEGQPGVVRPPALRRRCRVAASVTLLPGVEIGEDALVGAGSLVTRDVPPGATVAGNPARILRNDERGTMNAE
jgi:acetyltransferase-like isoleucine patch superfamily enzyme